MRKPRRSIGGVIMYRDFNYAIFCYMCQNLQFLPRRVLCFLYFKTIVLDFFVFNKCVLTNCTKYVNILFLGAGYWVQSKIKRTPGVASPGQRVRFRGHGARWRSLSELENVLIFLAQLIVDAKKSFDRFSVIFHNSESKHI